MKVAVVGAGSWGTAFARVAATNVPTVLWARNAELAATMEKRRENVDYLDKIDAFRRKAQPAEPIRIAGETDRVYLNTRGVCVVRDPVLGRTIRVEKEGSVLEGVGFESDPSLQHFEFQHQVRATVQPGAGQLVPPKPGAAQIVPPKPGGSR